MTTEERRLAALWPFVAAHLPASPARVLEIGCGPFGGFVPALTNAGYDALGVDPEAPEGPSYHRIEFEHDGPTGPVDAVVASVSLHHVADLSEVLDRITAQLLPGGTAVVLEWASERFDETTALWCFARLGPPEQGDHPGWLQRHRDDWETSGQPWSRFFQAWVAEEGLHAGGQIVQELDRRLDRSVCQRSPYFFADLASTTQADEQAAIDAGEIQPAGIRYVGRRR